eukprot:gnl/TRDRNA2_/TRDRNA2_160550_c2_seq3.p1 gnl/TRDRNA2_/TRDRNA2_160550_c2~~gnl/TRDRNA2_/TRDRNA2_160550_c2_seq3.p1  ORF type:complete len:224 (+),score=43.42 gnl/TRDRNA2_/TRDRNA2_160550_c2_seq3:80-673(+)
MPEAASRSDEEAEERAVAAERACERAAALQSIQEICALSSATTSLPVPSRAKELLQQAKDPGPMGLAARRELEVAMKRMEELKGRLSDLRAAKCEAVTAMETKVQVMREQNATLERNLQEAEAEEEREREREAQANGPPRCEHCDQELVLRQTTLLNSPDFSRWYWKCERRRCNVKIWDDTIPKNTQELLDRLTSLM